MPKNTRTNRRRKASAIAQRMLPMKLPQATYADLSRQETAEALRRSACKDLSAADALEHRDYDKRRAKP
jgi:hypothetical protein